MIVRWIIAGAILGERLPMRCCAVAWLFVRGGLVKRDVPRAARATMSNSRFRVGGLLLGVNVAVCCAEQFR